MNTLTGYRVLDLTHVLSGPYAGMLLADLGAEVIKVEPPGRGEVTRRLLADDPRYSLHGMGAYSLTLNRNKKSLTLNLKSGRGLALFYDLVRKSDVVLTNFSAGVTERLQIDHPRLSEVNPRIVTCSITGFGESGPGKDRPAFDLVVQAMGGEMSITGQPGAAPVRSGILIGDIGAGLTATIGILSALLARANTGRGQHVDISMLDTQISMLNYLATMVFLSGETPGLAGNSHFVHVPYNSYRCADGFLILAVVQDDSWARLMQAIPAPDLDTDEHRTRPGRLANREAIDRRLGEIFSAEPQAAWLDKLEHARVPCAPVNNLSQALEDAQVRHRNMVVEVMHPEGGAVQMPGNPVKLSEGGEEVYTPPPLLGQHTEALMRELLGKSREEIDTLRAEGVI